MSLPTFNGFSLQDGNFITERIVFKGFGKRAVTRSVVNRREGIKIVGNQFSESEITIEGKLVAASPTELQSLLDTAKQNLTDEEGSLVIEQGRTWRATVLDLGIADEHYNQTRAPYSITFVTSDPFSLGDQLTVVIPVPSGIITISGRVVISGTYYNRPVIAYIPPAALGNTFMNRFDLYHVETGQTVTVSGLGGGTPAGLAYTNQITFNLDDFTIMEGTNEVDNTGAFPKFDPGTNTFTITASGRPFPGGSVSVTYSPRYM